LWLTRWPAEAYKVVQNIQYQDWISLGIQQKEISLGVRLPDAQEVKRATGIISKARGPALTTKEEIYARETLFMKDYPKKVSIILQAFQLGELAITAIPCEVFVEIGLELKKKSPFKQTFNIELANGYNGYLPTLRSTSWAAMKPGAHVQAIWKLKPPLKLRNALRIVE
jgi:hypothetical protein